MGKWYLSVTGNGNFGSTPYYNFTYNIVQQNDCGSFVDAGNTSATATEFFGSCSGSYGRVWGFSPNPANQGNADPVDWYRYTLTKDQPISFLVSGTGDYLDGCSPTTGLAVTSCYSSGPDVEMRKPDGSAFDPPVMTSGGLLPGSLAFTAPANGEYRIKVSSTSDALYTIQSGVPDTNSLTGSLTNSVNLNDNCAADFTDASANSGGAGQLSPSVLIPASCYGNIGNGTDLDDWYKFETLNPNQMATFAIASGGPNVEVTLFKSDAKTSLATASGSVIVPGFMSPTLLENAGMYYLKIHDTSAAGDYAFTLDVRDNVGTNLVPTNLVPSSVPTDALGLVPTAIPTPSIGVGVPTLSDYCNGGNDIGNGSNAPTRIYSESYCYGTLGTPTNDTADWYVINAESGQQMSLLVSGDGLLDPKVEIYRPKPKSNTPPFTTIYNPGATPEFMTLQGLDAGGDWLVKISQGSPGSTGNYFLSIDVRNNLIAVPTIPSIGIPSIPAVNIGLTDDCNGAGDAPNTNNKYVTKQSTRGISNPTACYGSLGLSSPKDVQDWYSFTATKGQSVVLGVGGDGSLDPNITLYRPNGVREVSYPNTSPVPDYVSRDITYTGTWKVAVSKAAGSGNGHYGLYVQVPTGSVGLGTIPTVSVSVPAVPSLTGDCNRDGDAPGYSNKYVSRQSARDASPNGACIGSLGAGKDVDDWYQFGGSANQRFALLVATETSLDADVYLYDPTGRLAVSGAYGGLQPSYITSYFLNRTGTWRIKIHRYSGSGQYLMTNYLGS
ncbi:MAG: hypothetical protein LC750_18015 [Actinobacteria bacterium]|nr:hypothetical protein [Actinomycetota bacterium]